MKCPNCGHEVPVDKNPDGFEEWWRAYPRRDAKGQARRAYAKALQKASREVLIAGAKSYAALTVGREREFIRQPGTWLNGESWLDEQLTKPVSTDNPQVTSTPAVDSSWGKEADTLAKLIGPGKFMAWFGDSKVKSRNPVIISTPRPLKRDWIEQHFRGELFRTFGVYEIVVAETPKT